MNAFPTFTQGQRIVLAEDITDCGPKGLSGRILAAYDNDVYVVNFPPRLDPIWMHAIHLAPADEPARLPVTLPFAVADPTTGREG